MFLPVVTRELSVASRRRSTYSGRVGAAVLAIAAGVAVFLFFFQTSNAEQGRMLFTVLAGLAFAYSLLAGARSTSDCVSVEKREGTLGLLFLTDLKGYDVVLGKLVSSSVAAFYGLLAMIPVLGLAVILGGVSGRELTRVALVLVNTLFVSLAAGVFVSSISRVERKALSATLGLILLITFGPYPVAYYYTYSRGGLGVSLDTTFLIPSPYHAFELTRSTATSGVMVHDLYRSLLSTHLIGWSLLGLAAVILPRTFKDRPRSARRLRWRERWQQWSYGSRTARQKFRTRLLDRNPFFWLAGRDRLKANYVWLFLGLLSCLWYLVYTAEPEIVLDWSVSVWWLFFLCAFLKVWFTSEVCARLVEDRRCGALELLLTSPLGVKQIAKGQTLALRRQFAKPVAIILVAGAVLLLAGLNSRLFMGNKTDAIAMFAAGMILLIADLITLKWFGMWQSLTSNSAGRALIVTMTRVLSLPWMIFSACFVTALFLQSFGMRQMDRSRMFWVTTWFGIGLAVDLCFGLWARRRVLREFRRAAEQPLETERRKDGFVRTAMNLLKDVAGAISALKSPGQALRSRALLRRYRWVWSAAAVLLLAAGWFAWHRFSLARQVQAKLDALRAAKYPVTIEDLGRWQPAVPDKENAALKIQEAAAAITIDPASLGQIYSLAQGTDLKPDWQQNFGRLLSNNAAALRTLHQAASLPRSRFPADETAASAFRAAHLDKIYHLGPLLRAEAQMHLDSGNTEGAVESIVASFGLAHVLSADFNTNAEWIRESCLNLTCSSIEKLLTLHPLPERDLKKLRTLLAQAENEWRFDRVLAGQRAVDLAGYYLPQERFYQLAGPNISQQQSIAFGFLFRLLRITGIREADSLFYLGGVDEWIEMTQLPYPERLAKARALDQSFEAKLTRRPQFVLSRKLKTIGESEAVFAERAAHLRAAQTALSIECYRVMNGGLLPETLADLVPRFLGAIPSDPFDGEPLRYKRLESGYVVYSIGPDGKGKGGKKIRHRGPGVRMDREVSFIVGR
jgi:hypothetical protein